MNPSLTLGSSLISLPAFHVKNAAELVVEVLETTVLLDVALPLVSYHRNQVRGGNPLEKMALLHFCDS